MYIIVLRYQSHQPSHLKLFQRRRRALHEQPLESSSSSSDDLSSEDSSDMKSYVEMMTNNQ